MEYDTLHRRLAELRRRHGYSQEGLAEQLGITRQAVSKWESAQTQPDIQNLVALSELYGVSLDHLIKGDALLGVQPDQPEPACQPGAAAVCQDCPYRQLSRQLDDSLDKHFKRAGYVWEKRYTSPRRLWGLPLVDIDLVGGNFGVVRGHHAKGIVAIGNTATGLISIGMVAKGGLSLGLVSLGGISFGLVSLGFVALGTLALGAAAMGNIAVGLVSLGNISRALWLACGNLVQGQVAIGNAGAGSLGQVIIGDGMATAAEKAQALELIGQYLPWLPGWLVQLLLALF